MNGLSALRSAAALELLGDDDDMAAAHVDIDVGNADAVDQQWALTADELDRVACERLQMCHQAALGLMHELVNLVVRALGAEDQSPVAGVHAAVVQAHPRAVLDLLEHLSRRCRRSG